MKAQRPSAPTSDFRIPWAKPSLHGNEARYVEQALQSTWISSGHFVERLETEFALFTGAGHAVAVSSGTAALHLAYLAVGIGNGDEVIMPAMTFAGCAAMVVACGGRPRFIDNDPETMGLSVPDLRRALESRRAKAILAVHLFGNSCELSSLVKLAEEFEVILIEDAAESLGARYDGRHVGTFARVGCFSFQAAKTVTMGEGGMLVTDDDDLDRRLRLLRNHGFRPGTPYWHDVVGFNYRLTNLQAAVGCAQLERIEGILSRRREIDVQYRRGLQAIPGVRVPGRPTRAEVALWMQPVILDPDVFPRGRDWVRQRLADEGIETRPLFYPAYILPPYVEFSAQCPAAENLSSWSLTLPVYETLTTEDVDFICGSLARLAA